MSVLVVSSVSIPIVDNPSRPLMDFVDRTRALDGSYKAASTGNMKRDWLFRTPPITRDNADLYDEILRQVTPLAVSGDIIGNLQNMVTYSEQLDQWTLSGGTVTTNYAPVPAPNGTTTADGFNPPGGGYFAKSNLISGDANGRTFTVSVWLQSVSGTKHVTIGLLNQLDAPILNSTVAATNTWQRFSVTGTVASTTTGFRMFMQEADGNSTGWFNWGMQLREASTAGEYVRTTTAAATATSINCYPEVTGWSALRLNTGYRVVLDFALHEA